MCSHRSHWKSCVVTIYEWAHVCVEQLLYFIWTHYHKFECVAYAKFAFNEKIVMLGNQNYRLKAYIMNNWINEMFLPDGHTRLSVKINFWNFVREMWDKTETFTLKLH